MKNAKMVTASDRCEVIVPVRVAPGVPNLSTVPRETRSRRTSVTEKVKIPIVFRDKLLLKVQRM